MHTVQHSYRDDFCEDEAPHSKTGVLEHERMPWEHENPSAEDLEFRLHETEERILMGQALIAAYREAHQGADNLRYLRQMQKLRREQARLLQALEEARKQPLDFQAGLKKRAQTAFQQLVEMTLRREFDTPRYFEQEEIVRRYLREYEEGFEWIDSYALQL
ncbi:hypothetical protein COW36_02015 [bacterium (Candidatus Blackallbacteria) CG17_big_fil_post_rev_8_21_14_2_50_48_46]|uniref:Uncharacterized protein n=1 Tax=bacterium (Candidatus Blackallbacteria) CG17_big_fil_post_rev_8_21_14_2_50_48_46 TaxID=2014261 RepID=A0A2M7GAN1_9BACT|nr:MAG: hypothetical protein COW64_26405 [bacterium (Candidatus Blackallbacteria) CG18_big_fil_WC_8_21_14_2_50_49_26]PIW19210.1 MAG: hypothetical protein COW36_02015 [bacterium (Candidatus Blackallbacteria) CG17_big_fil_post_rev_8_21_14_2_50_48_46]PIW45440.1 MAG: hypothetical protein COW20_20125 [bacterium (Candidatus Blackallbacteria) CG13_big_fil_rev_8_21_14_2_50_49_14]